MSYYSSYRPSGASSRGGAYGARGYHSSNRSTDTPALPPDRDITDGLRKEIFQTIMKPRVNGTSSKPVKPENVEYLGSYNWVEEHQPTIIVPGSPPEWRDRPFPYRVPFDTGVRMVDQNGFRMGAASCLLPIFRAVDVVAEENADTSIDWTTVDFVTDRNNLRKLMRWLRYEPDETDETEPLKEFRIDLQLGGKKTVLMHRWEKRSREIAEPPKSGCGINFERQSTTPAKGCERSTGHHRIVQYDLEGLKMVVRFEVDACIPDPAATTFLSRTTTQSSSPRAASANVDSLTDMLSSLNVQSQAPSASATTPPTASADIAVIRAGSQVPQSTIAELTTRSIRYVDQFSWAEQYPQLFLSSTPHLFLAVHDRGTFVRMKKHEVGTAEIQQVERGTQIQRAFRQLVGALRRIQELAKEHGQRGRLSLVCRSDGKLEVLERTTQQGVLPDSELERFGV